MTFIYGLANVRFTSASYITMIEEQAHLAALELAQTGRIRVVVQDNGPIHTSTQVQQKRSEWEDQGLYLFFLSPYCSEMNPIESEWHQIKTQETTQGKCLTMS